MARIKREWVRTIVLCAIFMSTGVFLLRAETDKDIRYFGVNFRDPFSSFLPQEKKEVKIEKVVAPELKLQGIVWGGDKPKAIINNTVVGKEDVIQGAKIMDIKKEGIDLIYKEEYFWLDRSGAIKAKSETKDNK